MYGNPYYTQPQRYSQMPMNNPTMPNQQYIPPIPQPATQVGLLGKSVDSIEVVKAMDIPLDGSVSYFPLTDGSAIVTKQLQNDGTSKTIVYKPILEDKNESTKFVTFEEMKKELSKIDLTDLDDLKDELNEIRKELKAIKKSKEK